MTQVKIYELRDPITNEPRYVGKTKNRLAKRLWEHVSRTKKKKAKGERLNHKECWIQSLLDKGYKPTIHLVEMTDSLHWQEREIHHIAEYQKKHKLTNHHPGGMEVNPINKQKVAQVDFLTLNVVREFESTYEVERETGIPYTRIIDACSGRKMRVGGYLWHYIDDGGKMLHPDYAFKKRKVGRFNLSLELISAYENPQETGLDPGNIHACCFGKVRTAYGNIWRHLTVYNDIIEPEIRYKKKTVSVMNSKGELIDVFENAKQAAERFGLNDDLVRKACKEERLYHDKLWRYNDY
ncbi:MAG: hypothetical protein P8J32_05305 [bacterium]|nr:hypothetical protein [bacterium]